MALFKLADSVQAGVHMCTWLSTAMHCMCRALSTNTAHTIYAHSDDELINGPLCRSCGQALCFILCVYICVISTGSGVYHQYWIKHCFILCVCMCVISTGSGVYHQYWIKPCFILCVYMCVISTGSGVYHQYWIKHCFILCVCMCVISTRGGI